jgi:transketolase
MPPKRKNPEGKKEESEVPMKKKNIGKTHKLETLYDIATKLRIHSVQMCEASKSGHPTTCSSIAEIMAALFFDPAGMKYDPLHPENLFNDRLVLSKGHAAPILYAAWAEAGLVKKEDLLNLRKIDSDLEGHPTPRLNFVDVATGSLGQGLSAAAGMAYAAKYIENNPCHFFCICGDGEMSEGSCWEALLFAAKYELDNLTLIVDANRLGQSEETPHGHNVKIIADKIAAFQAKVFSVDGHDLSDIIDALEKIKSVKKKPTAIVAKTFKGKDFTDKIENQPGYHGKALEGEEAKMVIEVLKKKIKSEDAKMDPLKPEKSVAKEPLPVIKLRTLEYKKGDKIATRNSYGKALADIGTNCPRVVALDGDTKNSTMSIDFMKAHGKRFVECYIAEQNMLGVAVGMQTRGFVPFVSAFAAFHTRAYDFIRMSAISQANLKIVGSHAGVHIGQDGPSQMGLEDFAMMRAIPGSVVMYPSDAVSCEKSVELAANFKGITYIRTTRGATPVVYPNDEVFAIGKCKVHENKVGVPKVTVIGGGITFHEGKQIKALSY